MYKLVMSLIAALFLVGCATSANYQKIVSQWQGKQGQQLVTVWGSPDASVKLPSGNTVYLYTRQELSSASNYGPPEAPVFSVVDGTPHYGVGFNNSFASTQSLTLSCRTWFEMNPKGIIVNAQFQGNNCVASSPNRLKP